MRRLLLPFPLLLAVAVGGCATTVDHKKAEELVKKAAQMQGVTAKSASCPDGDKAKKGVTITCTLTGLDGSTGKVVLTGTNDSGHFDVTSTILKSEAAAQLLTSTINKAITPHQVTTTCPQVMVAKAGTVVTCKVRGVDGSSGDATVTEKDATGDIGVDAPFVHSQNIERTVGTRLSSANHLTDVQVTCPAIIPAKAGGMFECTAKSASKGTLTLEVTQTDATGHVTYKPKGS